MPYKFKEYPWTPSTDFLPCSSHPSIPPPQCCGSESGSGFTCFGPPGSGSGSGSFYHSAKIVRKNLISTVLWLLFDFLPFKNDVKVPSKSNVQKNFVKKIIFWLASCRSMMKIEGSGSASINQRHGSADPDPHQNVMDPQHCPPPLFEGPSAVYSQRLRIA